MTIHDPGAFAKFSRRFAMVAAGPAVWVAGLWLKVVPVYRGQRSQMAAIMVIVGAFSIAYLYLISPWFERRALRRLAARSTPDWLVFVPPLFFLYLGFFSFGLYSDCLKQSVAVTEADAMARQQQEVSLLARDYTQSAATSDPAERYSRALAFLASQGSAILERSAALDLADSSPAFGERLLLYAGFAILFLNLTFLWMSLFEYLVGPGSRSAGKPRAAARRPARPRGGKVAAV